MTEIPDRTPVSIHHPQSAADVQRATRARWLDAQLAEVPLGTLRCWAGMLDDAEGHGGGHTSGVAEAIRAVIEARRRELERG